jgi:hypothetical protein
VSTTWTPPDDAWAVVSAGCWDRDFRLGERACTLRVQLSPAGWEAVVYGVAGGYVLAAYGCATGDEAVREARAWVRGVARGEEAG